MVSLPVYEAKQVIRLPRPTAILRALRLWQKKGAGSARDDLNDVLTAFSIDPRGPVQALHGGVRNEAWVVPGVTGKKVIKRYKASVSLPQIQHEHSILRRLQQVDFPAPSLSSTQQGETIIEHKGRFFSAFHFLEGYSNFHSFLTFPSQEDWFFSAAGHAMAALHKALDGFIPLGKNENGFSGYTSERERGVGWYLQILSNCRDHKQISTDHPAIQRLCKISGWISERLPELDEELLGSRLTRSVIHGDFGPYNLMVKPGRRLMVLDFELSRIDWRLIDLVWMFSSITNSKQKPQSKRMAHVVRGYLQAYHLPDDELRLLPAVWEYMILRRLVVLLQDYQRTGTRHTAQEIQRRLDRFDWLMAHKADLKEPAFLLR